MNSSGDRINWYRTPIDKELLSSLGHSSDARAFLHIVPQILLSVLTGAAAYYAFYNLSLLWFLLALFLHGTFYFFLGEHAAIHELAHSTVFKTRRLNTFFLRLFGFLTWKNTVLYRTSHMEHHKATVYTGRDLEVPLPYVVTPLRWIGFFTFDCERFLANAGAVLRHSAGIISGEWENRLFPEADQKARKQLFRVARSILIGQLLLASLFIYFGQWILLVIFTFPYYASALAWLVTIPQHAGLTPSVPDFRLCCRSVKVPGWILFLHWNMDFHVEHHMYASVPFYNLPKLHEAIKHDLPIAKGFWKSWAEISSALKRQKKDPAYVIVPAIPCPVMVKQDACVSAAISSQIPSVL